jgi:hypothetical protein
VLDHPLEHGVPLERGREVAGDLGEGLRLLAMPLLGRVEPGVFQRDRRVVGERLDQRELLIGELPAGP